MPGVLKWLSAKLNCTSQIASLLAATSACDTEVVRGIIAESPDLGLYNTQGGLTGGRSALSIAAERGDLGILQIIYEGAVRARGEAFAKQSLNAGAERGQTPLMRACMYGGQAQHVQCVKYLLARGADPFAENDKGETCLHIAAKMAYTECLSELLTTEVSIGGCPSVRLADAVLPYEPPVRFIEMRNEAGFTALHLATLKNSPVCMQVLLGAGASLVSGILDSGNTPTLARGSTALHIAAARGSLPCCSVLLDFELQHPELDIRRIRNQRNLKPSHLAQLAGHNELAGILKAPSRPSAASTRDRLRAHRDHMDNRRHRRSRRGGTGEHHHHRPTISPEAVMDVLVARTQLLLALREVGLELDIKELPKEGLASVQAAHPVPGPDEPSASSKTRDEVAAAVAEFTDLWLKGKLEESESGSLLSSMVPADMKVAKLPDSILGDSDSGVDSFSAAALVQAALNAMAHFSQSAKPLDLPPTQLKPTSPLAAAVVVQVAIRKLAGKGSSYSTTSAATLINSMHQSPPATSLEHRHPGASTGKEKRGKSRTPSKSSHSKQRRKHAGAADAHQDSDAARVQVELEARTTGAQSDTAVESSAPSATGERSSVASASGVPPTHRARLLPENGSAERDKVVEEHQKAHDPHADQTDDPDAMPIWEGYESGLQEFSEEAGMPMWEGYDLGAEEQEMDPQEASGFQSHDAGSNCQDRGLVPIQDTGQTNTIPHSPPRRVPGQKGKGSSVHACESSSSGTSVLQTTPDRLRTPLKTGMDRKGSVGSAGILSPSETSCSTPVHTSALLLVTQASTATITDTEKDDNDSEVEWEGGDVDDRCAICMDQPLHCAISPCLHRICYGCSYQLCSRGLNVPICPYCRGPIATFISSHRVDDACSDQTVS